MVEAPAPEAALHPLAKRRLRRARVLQIGAVILLPLMVVSWVAIGNHQPFVDGGIFGHIGGGDDCAQSKGLFSPYDGPGFGIVEVRCAAGESGGWRFAIQNTGPIPVTIIGIELPRRYRESGDFFEYEVWTFPATRGGPEPGQLPMNLVLRSQNTSDETRFTPITAAPDERVGFQIRMTARQDCNDSSSRGIYSGLTIHYKIGPFSRSDTMAAPTQVHLIC